MIPKAKWLRRQAVMQDGYATGGGETGFTRFPQAADFVVGLWGGAGRTQDVLLPKGTIILAFLVCPYNGGDDGVPGPARGVPATGGTVQIDQVVPQDPPLPFNTGVVQNLLPASAAQTYARVPVGSPTIIPADWRVRFSVITTITPFSTDPVVGLANGAVYVGINAIFPRFRK